MKTSILILILFILSVFYNYCFSQYYKNANSFQTNYYELEFHKTFTYQEKYLSNDNYGFLSNVSCGKYLDVSGRYSFSKNYVHLPLTTVLLALAIRFMGNSSGCGSCGSGGSSGSDNVGKIVLIFFSLEGVRFKIPINSFVSIQPYLLPLGFDYYFWDTKKNQAFLSCCAGIQFKCFLANRFSFSLFADYKTDYITQQSGYDYGASLGLKFRLKQAN